MRCPYTYSDGARCLWNGARVEGEMCEAHMVMTRGERRAERKQEKARAQVAREGIPRAIRKPRAVVKVSQPSRVQSAREIIDKLPAAVGEPTDPTAPWCSCEGHANKPCEKCGKPDWLTWREQRCKVTGD